MALRDLARRLCKPFVLLTADLDTMLEAWSEETRAYLKNRQTSEAIKQLVGAIGTTPCPFDCQTAAKRAYDKGSAAVS